MMILILTIFLAISSLSLCQIQKLGPLSTSTIEIIKEKVINQLALPGKLTAEKAYYAALILNSIPHEENVFSCDLIDKLYKEITSFNSADVFYVNELKKNYRCEEFKSLEEIISKLKLITAESSVDIKEYSSASLALLSLNQAQPIDEVLTRIRPYGTPNGLFKSSTSDNAIESIENSGIVLQLLQEYARRGDRSTEFNTIAEQCFKLLPSGDDDNSVDPKLLDAIMTLSDAPLKLSSSATLIGELLLQEVLSDDMKSIALAIRSLQSLSTSRSAPFFIHLDRSSINILHNPKELRITVVNLLNQPSKINSIDVKSLKHSDQTEALFKGALDNDVLDLTPYNLRVGRYILDLSISIEERSPPVNMKKAFVIDDVLLVSDVAASITDSKQTLVSDLTTVSRGSLAGVSGSALNADVFHVSFSLSSESKTKFQKPHQAFIRFHHIDSRTDTFFSAKAIRVLPNGTGYTFRSVISLADEVETFLYLSGDYSVEVIAGSSQYENPLLFELGTVGFLFPAKPSTDSPLYTKSLQHTSDNTLVALPEISHKMRPPAKQASLLTSTVFTALVAAPLIGLFLFIATKTRNLKYLLDLSVLPFFFATLAVLGLYLGYWFALPGFSFYDTIRYMVFLCPAAAVFGSIAIGSITRARTRDLSEKKKIK